MFAGFALGAGAFWALPYLAATSEAAGIAAGVAVRLGGFLVGIVRFIR